MEELLKSCFSDLFDVTHQDAILWMTNEEDKAFLLAQREKGRKVSMAGIDLTLAKREEEAKMKHTRDKNLKKSEMEIQVFDRNVVLESSSSSTSEDNTDSEAEDTFEGIKVPPSPRRRGRKDFIRPEGLSSLDRTKINLLFKLSKNIGRNTLIARGIPSSRLPNGALQMDQYANFV